MTKQLSEQDVIAIKERAEKATPAPWCNVGGYSIMKDLGDNLRAEEVCRTLAPGYDVHNPDEHETNWKEDADFITHSREDVPRLCDSWLSLKGALELAEEECRVTDIPSGRLLCEKCDSDSDKLGRIVHAEDCPFSILTTLQEITP